MTTFQDTFNRADGAVGPPWQSFDGTSTPPVSDAHILNGRLVLEEEGAALIGISGTRTRRILQHMAFDLVSQVRIPDQWGDIDPPIAALWQQPNGQPSYGFLTRNYVESIGGRYSLDGHVPWNLGGPRDFVIPEGARIDVTYRPDGQLIIKVDGAVKLDVDLFAGEVAGGIRDDWLVKSWAVGQAGLMASAGGISSETLVIDNFTITYLEAELRGRPGGRRAYYARPR